VQDVVLHFKNASFSWGANAKSAPAPASQPTPAKDGKKKDKKDDKEASASSTEMAEVDRQASSETRDVLKNIDLKVKRGQVVMIIGSVGSGKRYAVLL
jgi:ABC-type multidrug transport system fused ATPase/permease subunit